MITVPRIFGVLLMGMLAYRLLPEPEDTTEKDRRIEILKSVRSTINF